jgi:hypothetical protein
VCDCVFLVLYIFFYLGMELRELYAVLIWHFLEFGVARRGLFVRITKGTFDGRRYRAPIPFCGDLTGCVHLVCWTLTFTIQSTKLRRATILLLHLNNSNYLVMNCLMFLGGGFYV